MKCPRCGFDQPEDIFCANCGIEIAKYADLHRKQLRIRLIFVIAGLALIILMLSFLILRKGQKYSPVSSPLTMEDTIAPQSGTPEHEANDVAAKPSRSNEITNPPSQPEAISIEPPKPSSLKVMASTIKDSKSSVRITMGAIDISRDGLKVMSMKTGRLSDVPYQIDSGWSLDRSVPFQKDDAILVNAADAGDRDDAAAAPLGGGHAWVVEVDDPQGGGKGWFYLYRGRSQQIEGKGGPIRFTKTPEAASTELYSTAFNETHPIVLDTLNVAGADWIDRLKVRISNEKFTIDEESITAKPKAVISGSFLARTRWEGTMANDVYEIPFAMEITYHPAWFETWYSFDFPKDGIKGAALSVYLDFSRIASGLHLVTSDLKDGKLVNGKGGTGEHQSKWFIAAVNGKALRVTLIGGSGKMVITDDTSAEDGPESEPGCFGCSGFEFDNPQGTMKIGLSLEVFNYKIGDKLPPPASEIAATPTPM